MHSKHETEDIVTQVPNGTMQTLIEVLQTQSSSPALQQCSILVDALKIDHVGDLTFQTKTSEDLGKNKEFRGGSLSVSPPPHDLGGGGE